MACGWTKQLRVLQLPNLFLHFGKRRHCLPCFNAFLLKPCSWGEFYLVFHEPGIIFQARARQYSLSPWVIPIFRARVQDMLWNPLSGCPGCACWGKLGCVRSCIHSCLSNNPLLPLPWNGNFTGLVEPNVNHEHAVAPSTERNSWTSQIIVNGT